MRRLRVGLVGAGYMGSLHAEKLCGLRRDDPLLDFVAVADHSADRAKSLAERCGVHAVGDAGELARGIDAAIVAVPTVAHYQVVRDLLDAGVDVLVEKPIAATLEEAEGLLLLAQARGRILQVGHLERFNNAMRVIREHIRSPRFIEGHRMGPFPARATDIDVVRDLMIHDLDILQELIGEEPERIEAVGVPVLTREVDIANARLTYPSGCVANLTASRVSATPLRKIRFFQLDGYFSVDFLAQTAVVARRKLGPGNVARRLGTAGIEIEELRVDRGDALQSQLRAFVSAVRQRAQPRVDGAGGLGALRTALRVRDAIPPIDFDGM